MISHKTHNILIDCIFLSDGTVSTLTGIRNYQKIDFVQKIFCAFVKNQINRGIDFKSWMPAWNAFSKTFLYISIKEKYSENENA